MNDSMPTSEVLDLAADKIQERGWVTIRDCDDFQDPWKGSGTGLCLEGGIMAAAGVVDSHEVLACPAYEAVWDYLTTDNRWGVRRNRLYDWNDTPGRTADEVIEVLRAAAMVERAKEAVGDAYDAEDQPLPVEQKVAA
jgi:hypothetical protein